MGRNLRDGVVRLANIFNHVLDEDRTISDLLFDGKVLIVRAGGARQESSANGPKVCKLLRLTW